MNLFTRLLSTGLDLVDALPRRRVPRIVALAVATLLLVHPGLVKELAELRARPIIEHFLRPEGPN